MFESIVSTIAPPAGLPPRAQVLNVRNRILDGTFYDNLPYEFSNEQNASGEYIPLRKRKPSVRYNLCRMVVEDSVSMLFGEGRFPTLDCADQKTREVIADIIDESNLCEVMSDAAFRGSVGSVVVLMRVLKSRVFWEAIDTFALTPAWDVEQPDVLERLVERRQVSGETLRESGYPISDDHLLTQFWFQREWNRDAEIWYLPLSVADEKDGIKAREDTDRTVRHSLGFVPAVWIRNLPNRGDIDGACTFMPAVETQIEIEYRLSQNGRALQYASDPLMMIREPAGDSDGDMVRSAANAILVGKDGDAKMLEIDGSSTAAVIEFVKACRDFAIEVTHGNRANPDKLSATQSGRAQELLHQSLINLTDRLRHSYGRGFLTLARMIVATNAKFELLVFGERIARNQLKVQRMKLQWGPYFPATIHDKQVMSHTLGSLKRDGLISRQTAVEQVADFEDISDANEEVTRIVADQALEDARLAAQPGVAVKAGFSEEV